MTKKLELYKCNVCGNLVQVILSGAGELVCCGEPMKLIEANKEENSQLKEKHTPVFEEKDGEKFVTLKYHPMTEEHYIQFIEVYPKDKSSMHLKYLNPNERAEFNLNKLEDELEAVEMCNIHGLWRGQNG